ncbi:MAG TPA: ribose-5-phosphate isomerase RpiA [Methylothermaceae bacterium]|nr:ribose-5-phosphate isomerase RpiA [Methylothermaceae bacterium]
MNDKVLVAEHVAQQVEDDMLVGLGTGSTADCFIEALARRHREEGLKITTVASSPISTIKAQQAGLPQVALEQIGHLDLYVDGADEVTPELTLLKGRGQDLVREKLLAKACDRFWVLIDASKKVSRLGERFPIPVEVWPFAWKAVQSQLEKLGATVTLRRNQAGVAITSAGGVVLDCRFDNQPDAAALNQLINNLPGVLEHGIFLQLAETVWLADQGRISALHPPSQ